MSVTARTLRRCFREPCEELMRAAEALDAAVSAHLSGDERLAASKFRAADSPSIRTWLDSIWGKKSPYVAPVPIRINALPTIDRILARMPTSEQKRQIHSRDGYRCRFCGLPVVRMEVRKRIVSLYPAAVQWGRFNSTQHAALQAMWAQYDHVVPHAHGGDNTLENLVLTCAACNFGRMSYTLEEVMLEDPRLRAPEPGEWDGLERLMKIASRTSRTRGDLV